MSFLILPQLKTDSDIRPSDDCGKWDVQQNGTFLNLASSLDYKAPGQSRSISAVPSMWARPLTLEMALHNPNYPIREELVEQWQGMLAAIALAEVRGFPLKAQLVELGDLAGENDFADALFELTPFALNTLYTLQGKKPWQDVYVFLWEDQPVGMSSPSTLVVPSEDGKWGDLPWWNGRTKRLTAPHPHLNETEKALFWRWLENLRLVLTQHRGAPAAINRMSELVDNFRNGLLERPPEQGLSLSDDQQFFGVALNRGTLEALNRPVKPEEQPSCVRLIPSRDRHSKALPLILIDPDIARAWNYPAQNIWIHEGKTLASLNLEDLRSGRLAWTAVRYLETPDLFLQDFKFIDLDNALPGAYLPEGAPITFNGKKVTPLLPLNPILLDYFTPEDLMQRLKLQPISGEGPMVRVTLDLPLSGVAQDESRPQNYRVVKDYPILEEHSIHEVPVLEIWPHFRATGWQDYYAFYYDAEYGEETFQVNVPGSREPHLFQEGRGLYQVSRSAEFPGYICAQDSQRQTIGLILLRTPPLVSQGGHWTVGVDFGTSFTNVYINQRGVVNPLPMENLHLKVTEVPNDTRVPVLFEYFVPEKFIPLHQPLPLSSVLTTRGKTNIPAGKERAIYDGRIYVPDLSTFQPNENWIETDLKWRNLIPNRLFLQHLALYVSAIAANQGVQSIQWSLSYPSAFSKGDCTRYAQNWQTITEELVKITGLDHQCPSLTDSDFFRTESLALAQYFADQEDHDLVRSTCIDMGGGTSDISIWEDNCLVHQCSVQLAGRDLFSQFLEMNPKFLIQLMEQESRDWQGLKEDKFNVKLDVWMRRESESWLKLKRAFVEEDEQFRGLLRLMAVGVGGLYFYVGKLLNVLHAEGKYSSNEITPVYLGGNGSRLLNWLAIGGQFDRHSEVNFLLSRMLSCGSEFTDTEELTRLSSRPKDEAACGLVLSSTRLTGLSRRTRDPVIAGEDCTVNGVPVLWKERLEFEDEVQNFEIPALVQLPQFLDEMNLALRELEVDGLTPMPQFKPRVGLEERYKELLWRATERELRSMLLNIKGESRNIRLEPPFILGLKALLRVLGKEWAGK
ncbi:hypothetical protein [Lyngbya confervoides]|uniref:Molecular chaperone n=1 Tax=Lyngbya confervoides BDU141951 TaxID=1574623 RepID=A0ABD4T283_9CYAN|nr:hypothetical protein [Lyngbya confervoides]MCM1982613.1 hypothetical protein [Lyngbya confervoides BDU141951]